MELTSPWQRMAEMVGVDVSTVSLHIVHVVTLPLVAYDFSLPSDSGPNPEGDDVNIRIIKALPAAP